MNRYQLEVAEIDRRHRLTIRALSFMGAAIMIVAALWSAGLPPDAWWAQAQSWFAESNKPPAEVAASTAASMPAPAELSTTAPVPNAEIFPGTDSSVSPSPQPLFLISTSPGRNKSEGTAQIGTNPDSPQTYVGGALLVNGARLAEIHREHVVLARDGASAKLLLYRRNDPAAPAGSELFLVGGEQRTETPIAVTKDVLTDYLRPSPLYDGELLRGYQVYPGAKAGMFARLGLQAGDVITAINGVPLSEPQHAMELFAELTRGSAVTATVERKNATQTIALDGALIVSDQDAAQNTSAQTAPPLGVPAT